MTADGEQAHGQRHHEVAAPQVAVDIVSGRIRAERGTFGKITRNKAGLQLYVEQKGLEDLHTIRLTEKIGQAQPRHRRLIATSEGIFLLGEGTYGPGATSYQELSDRIAEGVSALEGGARVEDVFPEARPVNITETAVLTGMLSDGSY